MNRILILVALTCSTAVCCGDDSHPPGRENASWGDLTGRIVFDGTLDDSALKPFQEELPIYEPISLRASSKGIRPRQIAQVPNNKLLINPKTRGIKNAIVYLRSQPSHMHPTFDETHPLKPVDLEYRNHLFSPRVFVLRSGQTLCLVNKSTQSADFKALGLWKNSPFNFLVAPQASRNWIPQKPEQARRTGRQLPPIRIRSSIHPTANAWCLITDHPYVSISNADGAFELQHLPIGEHYFAIWHESVGYIAKDFAITIEGGQRHELDPQKITAELLAKAR